MIINSNKLSQIVVASNESNYPFMPPSDVLQARHVLAGVGAGDGLDGGRGGDDAAAQQVGEVHLVQLLAAGIVHERAAERDGGGAYGSSAVIFTLSIG